MLNSHDAIANIAVKDLTAARQFYEGILGLEQLDAEGEEAIVYGSGGSRINVYRSQYAGTNKATAVSWTVGNVEAEVRALKAKGVKFEHYKDMPDVKLEGDVHVFGDLKIAWFKDPDGNILDITSR